MKYLTRFRLIVVVVICLATITGIAHSQTAEPEWWYYATTIDEDLTYATSIDRYWYINIREFPNDIHAVIGSMPPGCYLRIEATIGEWHQVALEGDEKGYVHSKAVREIDGDQVDPVLAQNCT